jgi:hypothetical protein
MNMTELNREIAKHDYENLKQESVDRLKYQIEYSQGLIRALTLANGGAIVALFTFIGNLDADGAMAYKSIWIWWAFAAFSAGLTSIILSSFGAFFSQYWYMMSTINEMWMKQVQMLGGVPNPEFQANCFKDHKRGTWALGLGIVAACVSLASFVAGSGLALKGVL